jgi:hypothetical protein
MCAFKEHPGASQQNIGNYFFFYGVNPFISRRSVGRYSLVKGATNKRQYHITMSF